jgi:hypothetical protein
MSKNQILSKMLDRLFAGLTSGPNLNCRPHSSRQRIDWMQFAKLQDISPADALRQLLSDKQATQLQARVTAPKNAGKPSSKRRSPTASHEESEKTPDSEPVGNFSPEDQHKKDNWSAQQTVLTKLRGLAEDAREYEQDTGVHVLHVGFPLLSLPPGAGGSVTGGTKRLLAPIAFIPISLELRAGLSPVIAIAGLNDGADFLVPNEALFAWLERQTGQSILPQQTVPTTNAEEGEHLDSESHPNTSTVTSSDLDSWEELNDLTGRVAKALGLPSPTITAASLDEMCAAPRTETNDSKPEIVMAAVIGLFPMNNQGLLRDMQTMSAMPEGLQGPVQSFISTEALLEAPPEPIDTGLLAGVEAAPSKYRRNVASERLVTVADPCQSRAVRLARESQGLVIHGPPGTGKSQTITNIIGDHLARGERVLLVCDKRTALDVVSRRLEHLGLGSLCALIHDPQHDQRNLYMQIREQLEQLTSTTTGDRAASRLQSLDRQLQKSYDTLLEAWSLVMSTDPRRHTSFHQRMGEWLECALPSLVTMESAPIKETSKPVQASRRSRTKVTNAAAATDPATVELLDEHLTEVRDIVTRAIQVGLSQHPWRECAGMPLPTFLEQPASRLRERLSELVAIAGELDRTRDEAIPAFILPLEKSTSSHEEASATSFPQQLTARKNLAAGLKRCLDEVDQVWRKRWAKASSAEIKRASDLLQSMQSARKEIESSALDPRLGLVLADKKTSNGEIAAQVGALQAYLTCCSVWYGWFNFGVRHRAQAILLSYGLPPDAASAEQLLAFLTGVTSREFVATMLGQLTEKTQQRDTAGILVDDAVLLKQCERLELLFETLNQCQHSALATVKCS